MTQQTTAAWRCLALGGLLCAGLALGACTANETADASSNDRFATAPSTSTDPGSRYLVSDDALGAVTVETPPVDASWTGGPTSIARPAPGSRPTAEFAAPSSGFTQPASSESLPPPPVRRTPPPPPPPALR